ncbi:MAG: DUF2892 domain-containing protein [Rhodospirillaceae bacterium]|nr:DUF2892 domain-containing protein [Rhodospirillaceae bacterium]
MAATFDKNVGSIDRALRAVLGVLMMAYTFVTSNNGEWLYDLLDLVVGVLGFSLVLSAILAHCWVYKLLGLNTCAADQS